MRLVKTIPHPVLSISVFTANGKYLLKLEYMQAEITYKIDTMDLAIGGVDELEGKLTNEFLLACFEKLKSMLSDKATYLV